MAKKESGSQGRKRRAAAAEAARLAQAQRTASGDLPVGLARLAALGPPPSDVRTHLVWASSVIAEALHQAAVDPFIDESTRRGQIASLGDKLLKAYPRAELEETMARLERDAKKQHEQYGAVRYAKNVQRPPTARGGARGPRLISDAPDLPEDDTPVEPGRQT